MRIIYKFFHIIECRNILCGEEVESEMGMKVKVSRGAVFMVIGMFLLGAVEVWRGGLSRGAIWAGVFPWLVIATAVLIHELGHVAVALGMGVRIRGVRLDLLGARLELGGILSYGRECGIAAGGPLANILTVALLYPIPTFQENEGGALFLGASLILGCVNLLPVGTLDGGRILRCALAWMAGDRAAEGVLRWTTGACLAFLWMVAVYALLRKGQMLSLFAFSLCLLARLVRREL